MEPAFCRGDILFLWRGRDPHFDVGEIVVFKVKGRDIPIVHRILEMHVPVKKGVRPEILTKVFYLLFRCCFFFFVLSLLSRALFSSFFLSGLSFFCRRTSLG